MIKKINININIALIFLGIFLLIFFNLGKNNLGHYRQEDNAGSLPYDLEWKTLDNPFFAEVMHYQYLNYHEYRYSTVAQNIFNSNDWTTLKVSNLGGVESYYHKGPAYFMLSALMAKVIGFGNLAVRFWPALFAFGLIVLAYLFAKDIFNEKVALLSALILATSFQFIHIDGARSASIDTTFGFFVLLALYLLANQKRWKNAFWWMIFSITMASLTRSIFMVFPVLISFLILDGFLNFKIEGGKKWLKKWAIGGVFILGMVCLWVGLQYFQSKGTYFSEIWDSQIKNEFLGKIELADPKMLYNFQYSLFLNERPSDKLFYPWTIFKGFFPWSIFVLVSLVYGLKIFLKEKNKKVGILLFSVLFIYLFISAKQQNWTRYANNLYPFLAILIAKTWYDFVEKNEKKFLRWGFFLTGLSFYAVIMPFNFSSNALIMFSSLALILLFFFKAILGEEFPRFFKWTSWGLLGYFLLVALINVAQPYFL